MFITTQSTLGHRSAIVKNVCQKAEKIWSFLGSTNAYILRFRPRLALQVRYVRKVGVS